MNLQQCFIPAAILASGFLVTGILAFMYGVLIKQKKCQYTGLAVVIASVLLLICTFAISRATEHNHASNACRSVIIYAVDGGEIATYTGNITLEDHGDHLLINADGLQHIVYNKTGTVIVSEVEEAEEGDYDDPC